MDFVFIYLIMVVVTFYLVGFVYSHEQPHKDLSAVFFNSVFWGVFWPVGLLFCASSFGDKTGRIRFYLKDLSENHKKLADNCIDSALLKARVDSLEDRLKVFEGENKIVKDLKEGLEKQLIEEKWSQDKMLFMIDSLSVRLDKLEQENEVVNDLKEGA